MDDDSKLMWLSEIDLLDLKVAAPYVLLWDGDSKLGIDGVAALMVRGGPIFMMSAKQPERMDPKDDPRPDPCDWDLLKREFCLFLCKRDRKYSALHKSLDTAGNKSSTVVLTLISAAMSPHIGISAGVLVPFCAVCLYALAKLGKEAYCVSCHCED